MLADEAITIKLLPLCLMPVTLNSSDIGSGASELKSAVTGIVAIIKLTQKHIITGGMLTSGNS